MPCPTQIITDFDYLDIYKGVELEIRALLAWWTWCICSMTVLPKEVKVFSLSPTPNCSGEFFFFRYVTEILGIKFVRN